MSNVNESIWSNEHNIIPMAEVSHIVKEKDGAWVIFKHSKIDSKSEYKMKYYPSIWLEYPKQFIKDWCRYRAELEHLI
jgi:hypothetical protein